MLRLQADRTERLPPRGVPDDDLELIPETLGESVGFEPAN